MGDWVVRIGRYKTFVAAKARQKVLYDAGWETEIVRLKPKKTSEIGNGSGSPAPGQQVATVPPAARPEEAGTYSDRLGARIALIREARKRAIDRNLGSAMDRLEEVARAEGRKEAQAKCDKRVAAAEHESWQRWQDAEKQPPLSESVAEAKRAFFAAPMYQQGEAIDRLIAAVRAEYGARLAVFHTDRAKLRQRVAELEGTVTFLDSRPRPAEDPFAVGKRVHWTGRGPQWTGEVIDDVRMVRCHAGTICIVTRELEPAPAADEAKPVEGSGGGK